MLKKILTRAGLFATLSVVAISCAPTAPSDSVPTLFSAPSSDTLTRTNPAKNSSIGLTCGCPFFLSVTGYGGDTGVIHFAFAERLDSSVTIHTMIAKIIPSSLPTGPATSTAWIGLYTTHDSVTPSNPGTPLYDTVHVMATY